MKRWPCAMKRSPASCRRTSNLKKLNEIRERQLAALIEAQLAVYKEKGIPLDLGLVAREFLAQYPRRGVT